MNQMQTIAILFSLMLIGYILWIIRKQRLKEEYSLLWLGVSVVFLIFSSWKQGLEMVADVLGIAYPPAALFIILLVGILLILIQFSMIISRLSERSKRLAQEYGLMKMEFEQLKRTLDELTTGGKGQDNRSPEPQEETSVPASPPRHP